MNKALTSALAALLASCACAPEDPLSYSCDLPCAVDYAGQIRTGDAAEIITCHVGRTECDEDGNMFCVGWAPIADEVCDPNNVDEDCDGQANNLSINHYSARNDCNDVGECRRSNKVCQPDGTWQCVYGPTVGAEICDGLDNDCNGLVDDGIPPGGFVYNGPPETLNVGECRAGSMVCVDGFEYLAGQVLPTAEVCGNDDDDDCDGLTDEVDNPTASAFSLVIDFSGSMLYTINAVADALCSWSAAGRFVNSRFAVLGVAADYITAPYLTEIIPMTDAGSACTAIRDFVANNGLLGGMEFIPYAVGQAGLVNTAPLAHHVVFFTDEPPQGYLSPPATDIADVTGVCAGAFTVSGFVSSSFAEWHSLTDPCGGWVESLTGDAQRMREMLDYRFGEECGL